MADMSNKNVALLVLASLVVVVVATSIQLSTLDELQLTGFATEEETGQVNLTINSSLNIVVDSGNSGIDFGTCNPPAQPNQFVADSNDTSASDCTGDTATPQRIQINNVGNVDANVTVTAQRDASTFIPLLNGSSGDFNYSTYGAGCAGQLQSTYTAFTTVADTANACSNLTAGGSFNLSVAVSIPWNADAAAQAGAETNTITFGAEIA